MTHPVIRGRAISVLVHADSKAGKSTFANSTPAPRLLIDAEMAYRFLPGTKVFWDPMRDSPPEYNGTWETCVVLIREYSTLTRVMEWLDSGYHPFRSVSIDSITEVQTRCKDDLSADGRMDQRLWGDLLTHMERTCRRFRDLTEHPTKPLEAVVITAMTQMRDGKWRPYVQGQLSVKMPYFMDVIGYLHVVSYAQEDPTQPHYAVRQMAVVPSQQYEAGERVQGRLPAMIYHPTVTQMLDDVFGPLPAPPTEGIA